MQRHLHCEEQPIGCKTQWNYDIHVWKSQQVKHISCTFRAATGVHQIHKNCACHEKWEKNVSDSARLIRDRYRRFRPWPAMSPSVRNPLDNWAYFSRWPQKIQISPNAAPAMTSDTATSPSTAPARRHDCETWVLSSPSTAPATKSDLHQILHLPRKLSVQLDCNFTKYCTCHEKWPAPNFAPATKTERATWLQLHQVLHLPRKVTCTKYCTCHDENWVWNSTATSPSIAPATKVTVGLHQILHLPRGKLSLDCNQILALPLKVTVELHQIQYRSTILWLELFFYSTLWHYYPLILLFFDSTILWLYYSFTLLFFDSIFIILLYYSFTLWSRLYIGSFSIKFLWLNLRWVNKANQDKTNKQKTQTKIKTKLKQNFSKTMAANISLTGLADNLLNQNEIQCTVINRGFTTTRSHLGLWESFWLNKLEDEA